MVYVEKTVYFAQILYPGAVIVLVENGTVKDQNIAIIEDSFQIYYVYFKND